jgi:molybdopterin-guanine dinucleotide biosynthesis adapter protein
MKLFGFVGASGSGKTTLITRVLPQLRRRGVAVSTIKHAHHGFEMDRPGKDSARHREAGAQEVMVVSDRGWAILRDHQPYDDLSLVALASRMAPVDILLVEGFKLGDIPKIEVYRPALGKPALYLQDAGIAAVATNGQIDAGPRAVLPLDDPEAVAAFVMSFGSVAA